MQARWLPVPPAAAAAAATLTPPPLALDQAAELRGQLSRIMPPLEVDWAADATINTTRLPSRTAAAGARPQSPLGVFERRPSMRLDQHPDLGLASPFQQGGAAGPPGGEHGAQRLPSGAGACLGRVGRLG